MNNKKSFIALLICILSFGFFGSSCSDMLEPNMDRYSDKFAEDSIYSAFGILMSMQNVAERSIILDATRSDLVTTGTYTTDSIMELVNFEDPEDGTNALLNVADYYHVINSCNQYLAKVDTVSTKDGYAEMKREYAAIMMIRSWTYLQLINIYGTVPYITEPISSVDDASRLMASSPKISKDNIIDLFAASGVMRAYELQASLGLPNYGNLTTGSGDIPSGQMFVPGDLVLGDAYLMQNQYQKAAEKYFHFFDKSLYNNVSRFTTPYNATMNNSYYMNAGATGSGDNRYYDLSGFNWLNAFSTNNYREKLVVSASASRKDYGKVMTGVQNIFGFATSISRSSAISISANAEYQQLLPSQGYISLNQSQNFNRYDASSDYSETCEGVGDARLYATAPMIEFQDGERTRIIDKFVPASSRSAMTISVLTSRNLRFNQFNNVNTYTLYRNPVIWLRYAEAINRMGFPEMAFGVLKDGLSNQSLPTYGFFDKNVYFTQIYQLEEESDEYIIDTMGVVVERRDSLGNLVYDDNGFVIKDSLWYIDGAKPDTSLMHVEDFVEPEIQNGGCYYVSLDEIKAAENYPEALGFKVSPTFDYTQIVNKGYGIHGRGCGDVGGRYDTIYTYARMVAKKIAEDSAIAQGWTYEKQLECEARLHNGDTLLVTDKNLIINAVENLIVDEGALETAFESNRFTDLMRIAGHKTEAGLDGTKWLAWKVARRDYNVTDDYTQYNRALYEKLLNQKKWFLSLPVDK